MIVAENQGVSNGFHFESLEIAPTLRPANLDAGRSNTQEGTPFSARFLQEVEFERGRGDQLGLSLKFPAGGQQSDAGVTLQVEELIGGPGQQEVEVQVYSLAGELSELQAGRPMRG